MVIAARVGTKDSDVLGAVFLRGRDDVLPFELIHRFAFTDSAASSN
jgi:hypothetical protein